ncbi:hypothetical protein YC2023_054444 [Brassica napus]
MLLLWQIHGYKSCILKERKALLELKDYLISKSSESLVGSVLKARPEEPDLEYGEAIPVLSNYETWTNDTKSDCCWWNGIKCNRTSGRFIGLSVGSVCFREPNSLLNLSFLNPFDEVQSLNLSGERYVQSYSGFFDDVEGYKSLRRLRNLEILDVSWNGSQDGPFPIKGVFSICHDPSPGLHGFISELTNLPKLELLNLARNNFSGPITGQLPLCLGSLKKLRVLDLSSNQFSGNLPSSFISLESLEYLSLLNNNFSSLFSLNPLTNLTNLKVFKVSSTSDKVQVESEGKIGVGLLSSTDLSMLDMSHNCFTGAIPSSIPPSLLLIEFLDLSGNLFSGALPSSQIEEFQVYFAAFQEFEIKFATKQRYDSYCPGESWYSDSYSPDEPWLIDYGTNTSQFRRGVLDYMYGMDLSNNELSGFIPTELGGLWKLRSLNLSHNFLSSSIPSSFSNLKDIESLDLSYNKLHGSIPQQLTSLFSLAVFDVSYNNLSGIVPQGRQFNSFDSNSYIGNPLLCGLPTNISCDQANERSEEEDSGGGEEENEADMDRVVFYYGTASVYVTTLVCIVVLMCFDCPWRRAWLRIVDAFIASAKHIVSRSLVSSEWSTDEASFVAGIVSVCWRSSEAWSLVKLFRSRMHRFGVDVLVRVLNSYLLNVRGGRDGSLSVTELVLTGFNNIKV